VADSSKFLMKNEVGTKMIPEKQFTTGKILILNESAKSGIINLKISKF
jgi:hypothetical protein